MSAYVLGAGGIGTLVGCALLPNTCVNFIARTPQKIEYMKQCNNIIKIKQLFDNNKYVEYQINGVLRVEDFPGTAKIEFLLVCVKTFDTIKSLKPLLPYITKDSRILLIQNGMGVIDELYRDVWPEIDSRPTIYQGVISHGVWQESHLSHSYDYNHAGFGSMRICKLPRDTDPESDEMNFAESDSVIRQLIESNLNVTYHSYQELLIYQVQKLMVNMCINTLTSTLDCLNGELGNIDATKQLFQSIITEGMQVMKLAYPIIMECKLGQQVLQNKALLDLTEEMGVVINSKTSSSMRQDTLNLRDVEIEYISGFIVNKAKELGISAPVNNTIRLLVWAKLNINRNRKCD